MKKKIMVFDNGGLSFDRYTVQIDDEVYGMSADPLSPQGFNQYVGSLKDSDWDIEELGKRISLSKVPAQVRKAIKERTK
jgi:hypothetical protein